jgi:hypothetical protein
VRIKSGPSVRAFRKLHFDIGSGFPKHDLEVVILETLRNLVENEKTLMANFAVFILQEVDDMFWDSHVKASFDFI